MELTDLSRLTRLLEDSRPRMLAMIARRSNRKLRSRRDAEDIYQLASEKAWESWSRLDASGSSEKSWLYRIVLDCLGDDRDYQLRIKRSADAEAAWPTDSSMQLVQGLVDRNPGPRTEAEQREASQRLQLQISQVLEKLTPSEREVLCMRIYEELEHKEIAEILEITEVAVRKRYSRALVEFQDYWLELFEAPWTGS